MIHDKIENLARYIGPVTYDLMKKALISIDNGLNDGHYELSNDMYFNIETYDLLLKSKCRIENHHEYVDVQISLNDSEGISVFDSALLSNSIKYDLTKDVEFFENSDVITAYCLNTPGFFTLLFPGEAHRPKEQTINSQKVRKVVFKIKERILNE